MKFSYLIFVMILVLAGSVFCCQRAFGSDVLKYEDDQGHLILVDSPAKIPARYRNRVESVPSGKEAEELNVELTKIVLKGGSAADLNGFFIKYLFLNRWTAILVSLFILAFLLPVIFRNSLSRMSIFVSLLFLFLIFHLVVFVPKLQERVYRFSGIVRHKSGVSLPVETGIRHKVLAYRIHSEALPLIPLNIYAQVLELRKLQSEFQVQK
ncbi:MAG: hypothetical protein CO090_06595 [Acidobacteria bacterium CG_4_9_14_3_um_filter_49_7]|nr:MAG: hypothetical protein CO090_06595 [Acidobacteria bacterium CG_4_9_14_3_um_filter_49_7]